MKKLLLLSIMLVVMIGSSSIILYASDTTPPTLATSPTGGNVAPGLNIAPGQIIGIATSDDQSGINCFRYMWDDGEYPFVDGTSKTIKAPTKPGRHKLTLFASDKTGSGYGGTGVANLITQDFYYTVIDSTKAVKSVSLNKSGISIAVKETKTLVATVSPSNSANKSVKWSSSNSKIAKVSSTGKITGVKAGIATITVKTVDGRKIAKCKVTVTKAPIIVVKSVSLNKSSTSIAIKETKTLVATVSPSNAANKSVTWSSSNSKIVKVSNTGKITGVKAGTATITVKTADGRKIAKCKITVTKP